LTGRRRILTRVSNRKEEANGRGKEENRRRRQGIIQEAVAFSHPDIQSFMSKKHKQNQERPEKKSSTSVAAIIGKRS